MFPRSDMACSFSFTSRSCCSRYATSAFSVSSIARPACSADSPEVFSAMQAILLRFTENGENQPLDTDAPNALWCGAYRDGTFFVAPAVSTTDIVVADIDLRRTMTAKRWFDVVGHYARPDVFAAQAVVARTAEEPDSPDGEPS